ncbi:MAG: Gldg family protein [Clostridia bacterium]|nr:Gldg family protein [Clostridia bacterium]
MKTNNGFNRKIRYGSASLGIVAAVIGVVILINAVASLLCSNNLWFTDLTTEPMYGLTEQGNALLGSTIDSANATRPEDKPVKVDIIFCADPDMLYGNEMMRYIYYTALQMEKAYSDTIHVQTVDVWDNPSAVDAYRTNSYSSIYQTNVIVASGTEFRVYNYKAFYTYSSDTDTEPWAYNAEKTFIKGIIAVTRAEAPICAITVGHGEPFHYNETTQTWETEYTELLKVIEGAGYDIDYVNLTERDLPENCRLVVTFDPQTDFVSGFLSGGVSELSKLEKHLNNAYSYMVFVDADTPKLTNLEEFLEEWGIAFERYDKSATYEVIDVDSSLNIDGTTIIGQYAQDGLGGSLTTEMRKTGTPKVVFGNALSITYSPTYEQQYKLADEEAGTGAYTYGYYYNNNWSRDIFDVFTASNTAVAYAKENGVRVTEEDGDLWKDTSGNYKLMTITRQTRTVSEGKGYTNVYDNTYVCAVGSTDFASNKALSSNAYGNTDILLSALRTIGREIVPVGFEPISLYDDEMSTDYYTEGGNIVTTVVLVALPTLILAGVGMVILIKRRVRR